VVGAKIFGAKVHSSSELRVFRHLWSRSDAPCSSIMYQGRNHWRVGLSGPPTFWRTPQLLIQRFCRGVHRQASRVNLVYNTAEERKMKFFLLLLQVLSAFYVSYYGVTFGNAKRFLYIKFILLFCILSVRRANVITSLIYLGAVPYSNFESLMTH